MTYAQKLRDPRWQKKKADILTRDDYTCQAPDCGSKTDNLQVHHLEYLGNLDPWEYSDDLLITLCEKCHAKETGREKLETHLATTLKMKGFLISDLLAFSCKLETEEQFTKALLKSLRNYQR